MQVELVKHYEGTMKLGGHPYFKGAWTPQWDEVNAADLEVIEGVLPADIDGIYLRNTQNPLLEPLGTHHPFDGDGMLHMISFRDGRAEYRNRFIRTRGFEAELEAGKRLWGGLIDPPGVSTRPGWGAHEGIKDASSTDVVVHAGRALTTYYQCGDGYRLDPYTLEQEGIPPWSPIDGISAHQKVDEATGELLFFNYSVHAPYMHYGIVDRNDKLVHYVPIPLPGPRLPHDMAFSKRFAVLNDFPLFWDPELLQQNKHAVRFYPELPSRFGVIPRYGSTDELRWFDAAPTYVLHWLNCYEDGDDLVLDGYFEDEPMPKNYEGAPDGYERAMSYLDQHQFKSRLHRWRFNLRTGQTAEERLDDRILEFGMFNQQFAGRKYRYAYSAVQVPGIFLFNGYVKHDLETGESWRVMLPAGEFASEAPFAPRIGAQSEDDGYLVTFIINENTGSSEAMLIDCKRFDEGPVCRIQLPHKLCSGTHSCWANGADIRDGLLRRPA